VERPPDELLELEEELEELDEELLELLEELEELLEVLLDELLEELLEELLDELEEPPELEVPPQAASDMPHTNTANRNEIPIFIIILPGLIPAVITASAILAQLKVSKAPMCKSALDHNPVAKAPPNWQRLSVKHAQIIELFCRSVSSAHKNRNKAGLSRGIHNQGCRCIGCVVSPMGKFVPRFCFRHQGDG
jgi:hypothetical protein